MPEGDTIARAAAALDRALAGQVVTAFATGLAQLARDRRRHADRRPHHRARRVARQAPAAALLRRADAAHPHADARLVAPLSSRRTLAAIAAGDADPHRHRRVGGRRLRHAGRRVRPRRRPGAASPAGDARPRPRRSGRRSRRRGGPARRRRRPADRRGAPRSARGRRHRQRAAVRDAVPRRRPSRSTGRIADRRRASAASSTRRPG